jgi:hypothetical protein
MSKSEMTNAQLQADAHELIIEIERRAAANPLLPPKVHHLIGLLHFVLHQLQRALLARGQVTTLSGGAKPD